MVSIYILQLQDNKYYVGKSNNPKERIKNHFNGNGAVWTQIYKPIKTIKIIPNQSDEDENKYTKIYMKKYGIENVRGGSYCQIDIPKNLIQLLQYEIQTENDCCFRCGREGHYASNCYAKTDINGNIIQETDTDTESEEDYDNCCFRCGREGHYASNCYAKTDINGKYIIN